MKVQSQEYGNMRDWFAHVSRKLFPPELVAKAQPLTYLDELAASSPAKAREGLSMGINDLIEMTDRLPAGQVQELDDQLAKDGLPTLSVMRVRFSKSVARVIRRGSIKDDVEYYAVRNVVELAEHNQEALWKLLSAYEQRLAG